MTTGDFFRGGNSLKPRPNDVKIDRRTGLLDVSYGVSVLSVPDGLDKFGGPYRVTNVPDELHIIRQGGKPHHYVIAPARPMTPIEYEEALAKIVLVAHQT